MLAYMKSRPIEAAWIMLMALTVGTMFFGRVTTTGRVGAIFLVALAMVTFFKARIILRRYLHLNRAPGWAATYDTFVAVVLICVVGLFLIGNAQG